MNSNKRLISSISMAITLTLVIPGISMLMAGCGGSKSASSVSRLATIKLTVAWPDRQPSRLIPLASESIKVTITNSSGFVKSQLLERPTATLLIGDLPPGELQIQAVAYPTANPVDDVAQAVVTQMVTAVADQVFDLALTLASTVDHVAIGSSVTKLRKGEETTMSVSAYDISNRLVLTSPETWRWSTSNPAVLTVGSATQPGYVFATSKGNASVQVLESESGKTASFMLDVVSPLPQLSLTGPATEQLVGQESMLSWTAMDASSVISSNFGASTTSGNIAVSPKVTTTYTLKVANDQSETIEKSVVLRVAAVSVTVTPTNGVVDIGKTLQLSASVNGATDTGVSWSVVDAGVGKVTATGLYTAPLTQGTYRVKATSSADPSKSATCDVRVRAAGGSIIIN
jgi:hypothetical protein